VSYPEDREPAKRCLQGRVSARSTGQRKGFVGRNVLKILRSLVVVKGILANTLRRKEGRKEGRKGGLEILVRLTACLLTHGPLTSLPGKGKEAILTELHLLRVVRHCTIISS
jgi:hypothetical protein